MREALALASQSARQGEVPVGAVVVTPLLLLAGMWLFELHRFSIL